MWVSFFGNVYCKIFETLMINTEFSEWIWSAESVKIALSIPKCKAKFSIDIHKLDSHWQKPYEKIFLLFITHFIRFSKKIDPHSASSHTQKTLWPSIQILFHPSSNPHIIFYHACCHNFHLLSSPDFFFLLLFLLS